MIETSLPLSSTNGGSSVTIVENSDTDLVSDGHTYYSKILGVNRLTELILACINGIADKIWTPCKEIATSTTWFKTICDNTCFSKYSNCAAFYYNGSSTQLLIYPNFAIKDIGPTYINAYGWISASSLTSLTSIRIKAAQRYNKNLCNVTYAEGVISQDITISTNDYDSICQKNEFLISHILASKLESATYANDRRDVIKIKITKEVHYTSDNVDF